MGELSSTVWGEAIMRGTDDNCEGSRVWRLGVLALVLVATSCAKANDPPSEDIQAALASVAGPGFSYKVSEKESFVDSQSGQGRVSVLGEIVAIADAFRPATPNEIESEYARLGIPPEHIPMLRKFRDEPTFIVREVATGDKFPLNGELLAQKQAEGWILTGTEQLVRSASLPRDLQSAEAFGRDSVVIGGDKQSPYLKWAVSLSREISENDAALIAQLQSKLKSGLKLRFWQKAVPQRAISNDEPFPFSSPIFKSVQGPNQTN